MYSAGAHTTVGTIRNFILAMVLYPEVFRKAHEEVNRVVGTERLLKMSDRVDLPYLKCVLLETLRWQPVVPLVSLYDSKYCGSSITKISAIPHRIMQDDEYRGYRIPAKSTIISNIYGVCNTSDSFCFIKLKFCVFQITRDDHVFLNPETFNPKRFDYAQPGSAAPNPVTLSLASGSVSFPKTTSPMRRST
jgi:hypothetical protein